MIEAEHLFKFYASRPVVNDLSLQVQKGAVLGFIGPNGAGKTTTMKMLCGVMPIPRGSVRICGIDMAKNPVCAKQKLGYLPENAPLYPSMTVRAFLDYCAKMHGIDSAVRRSKINDSIEKCALKDVLEQELDSLSKGYKRRVCLAQAIMHGPEVLILDEPTDGLDPNQKREIRRLIAEIREHTAIIVSTHILEEIESVCDRVLVLSAGKKMFDGSTDEFKKVSPDAGTIEITMTNQDRTQLENEFKTGIPGSLLSMNDPVPGEWVMRFAPSSDVSQEELLMALYARSAAAGLRIQHCNIKEVRLEDVFAMLAAPSEGGRK